MNLEMTSYIFRDLVNSQLYEHCASGYLIDDFTVCLAVVRGGLLEVYVLQNNGQSSNMSD